MNDLHLALCSPFWRGALGSSGCGLARNAEGVSDPGDDSRNRCTVRITLNKKKHLVIILLLLPYFPIKSLIIIGLLIDNNHQSIVNNP